MEQWTQYVKPELLILIPVLYLLGKGLKKSTLPDHRIPLVLGGAGVAFSLLYVLATQSMAGLSQIASGIFTACTQGILAAGAGVYTDQLIKQNQKRD